MLIKKLMLACSLMLLAVTAEAKGVKLKFDEEGKFKIVQITDVHYIIGSEGSAESLRMIGSVLDKENPDLVIFTGDVITCSPQKQGWDEVLATVIEREIPYAVVFGNHDDEQDWTRSQIMGYIMAQPYCLSQPGPKNIKGTGNFVLEVNGREGSKALLYCMDSNAYNTLADSTKGYDWLGADQIDWYKKNSSKYTKKNSGMPYPALAFFHIPLQEYSLIGDLSKHYVKNNYPCYGTRREKECAGLLNTGMFAAMAESGDVMGVFVGHDHDNDYIGYLNGICLAYGRFSGSKENIYNNIGYGARVIELKEGERYFKTWVIDQDDNVLHEVEYPASFTTAK